MLVSPADHAQHAMVRAEEQRVSEHAETNTWVSTWTSEQLVESAKTLPKPRPHITVKTFFFFLLGTPGASAVLGSCRCIELFAK